MIIITDGFIKIFSPDIYSSGNLIEYISYLWVIINQSSIWFATSPGIFLFPKVTNFSHHIFLWLKDIFNRAFPLLMGFLLILWLLAFSQSVEIINDHRMSNRNTTYIKVNFSLLNLGVIFLCALSLITSFLLIISLWRHNRHCS